LTRKEKEQQLRKNLILKAAKEEFAKDGYDHASMNVIAKNAEFTKRTLYKYFIDKADLYLSVLLEIYSDLYKELSDLDFEGQTGFHQIKMIVYGFHHYYMTNFEDFKIMYDIGKVRQLTDNEKILQFVKIDREITQIIIECIIKGQTDGSITNNQPANDLAVHLKFMLTAVFNQLTVTGESFTKHIGKTQENFTNELIGLILLPLKC